MANPTTPRPSLNKDSSSSIEFFEKSLFASKQINEKPVKYIKNEIRQINYKIKASYKDLIRFLKIQVDKDLDSHLGARIPKDDDVSTTLPAVSFDTMAPEDIQNKIFSDPTYQVMVSTAIYYDRYALDEINRREAELIKLLSNKAKNENLLDAMQRYQGDDVSAKVSNTNLYSRYIDQLVRVNDVHKTALELTDPFDDFPKDYTVQDAMDRFNSMVDIYCIQYKSRYKNLMEKMNDFIHDYPEYTNNLNTFIVTLSNTSVFPEQYPEAVGVRKGIIDTIGDLSLVFNAIRDDIINNLETLSVEKGIPNAKVKELIEKTKAIVVSETRIANTEKTTLSQQNEKNRSLIDKSVAETEKIRHAVEDGLNEFTNFINKSFGDNITKAINQMAISTGLMRKKLPLDVNAGDLQNRNIVRSQYGDLRFCDEAPQKVVYPNNVVDWAPQRNCVFNAEEKIWMHKDTAKAKEYMDKHGVKNPFNKG